MLENLPSRAPNQKICPTCGQPIGGGMKPGLPGGQLKPTPFLEGRPIFGDRPPPNSPLMYTQVAPPPGMKYVYNQQTGQRSTVPIDGGKGIGGQWQNSIKKPLPVIPDGTPGIGGPIIGGQSGHGRVNSSFRPTPHIQHPDWYNKQLTKPPSKWRKQ